MVNPKKFFPPCFKQKIGYSKEFSKGINYVYCNFSFLQGYFCPHRILLEQDMVLVKVFRITSFTAPDTGEPGKQLEMVEVKRQPMMGQQYGGDDTVRFTQTVISQIQSMGILPQMAKEINYPKIILFLTEKEFDQLEVPMNVNDTYELMFEKGKISFSIP